MPKILKSGVFPHNGLAFSLLSQKNKEFPIAENHEASTDFLSKV